MFGLFGRRPSAEEIGLEELRDGLSAGKIALIDVREASEFAAGHVPGALHNPLSQFDVSALPPAGEKRIVLICRSGSRSAMALRKAQADGRPDVKAHFRGGMMQWSAAGLPVE